MVRFLYVKHATLTPLVIGTNGGMGDECEKFLKNLAELLAKEDGEEYSDVMMNLRTMLSFKALRAATVNFFGQTGIHRNSTGILPEFYRNSDRISEFR